MLNCKGQRNVSPYFFNFTIGFQNPDKKITMYQIPVAILVPVASSILHTIELLHSLVLIIIILNKGGLPDRPFYFSSSASSLICLLILLTVLSLTPVTCAVSLIE